MPNRNYKSKAITAAEQWTDPLFVSQGAFTVSISGTFSATVTVQRRYPDTGWLEVETFTVPEQMTGYEASGAEYRIGVGTGDYASGTANVRIQQ